MSTVRPSVYMGPAKVPNGTASLPKRDRSEKSSIRNRTKMSTVRPSVYMGPATVPNGTASLPKRDRLEKSSLRNRTRMSTARPSIYMGPVPFQMELLAYQNGIA